MFIGLKQQTNKQRSEKTLRTKLEAHTTDKKINVTDSDHQDLYDVG